jgi:predicted metalloprotease
MRWSRGDRSNVEDLRDRPGIGMRAGVPLGLGGMVIILLLSWLTGTDLLSLLGGGGEVTGPPSASVPSSGRAATSPEEERLVDFVDAVMRDTQNTWQDLLGERYQPTRVRLFRDVIQSACGTAESATGPFYCPADDFVYLDLGFFEELRQRFAAPGEFAQAYVVAHEVGHHVQALLGIDRRVRAAQQARPSQANAFSVALELQADCFAGVWGHAASQPGRAQQGAVELDPGDVEAGLRAAAAIGDDRIQRIATGRVFPERFTHGSSEQRVTWFKRGLTSGSASACNTLGGEQ